MRLNLKNPIIFFDLETTGINIASDRIVEISYLKVDLNGNESIKDPEGESRTCPFLKRQQPSMESAMRM